MVLESDGTRNRCKPAIIFAELLRYCWRTQKCRKWCLTHGLFEGREAWRIFCKKRWPWSVEVGSPTVSIPNKPPSHKPSDTIVPIGVREHFGTRRALVLGRGQWREFGKYEPMIIGFSLTVWACGRCPTLVVGDRERRRLWAHGYSFPVECSTYRSLSHCTQEHCVLPT